MTLNLSMTVGNPNRADNNVYGFYQEYSKDKTKYKVIANMKSLKEYQKESLESR